MSGLADELRERFGAAVDDSVAIADVEELAAWLIHRGVGKRGGRRRSRRERPEAPELGAAARRFARGLSKRACEGDTEGLEQLVELYAAVDDAMLVAGRGLHGFGYSWTDIGRVVGTSRQNARQRFGQRLGEEGSE